jgi:uncharacterized protein (DUF924 family)
LTAYDQPAKAACREPIWVGEVIHFWFAELGEGRWFAKSAEIDAQIRDRFLPLHKRLLESGALGIFAPRPILAAVIVLDQFSRNLFRADARAFFADPIARRLSRDAIAQGLETKLQDCRERYFLYLPFEHSEDTQDQLLAQTMIQRLGNDIWTRHAAAHMKVIERFGRFPQRNEALQRPSTAEELAFLNEPLNLF